MIRLELRVSIFFLVKKKSFPIGRRDGLPRDASVFRYASGETAAFPADKFHGPDYLVKFRRGFGTFDKMIAEKFVAKPKSCAA
jgi:hypothetical protein